MSTNPLPELEQQLVAAARRLDAAASLGAAAAPRRSWWRHGSGLALVVVATLGVGVATAQVAGLTPFSYLSGTDENPQLAPKDDAHELTVDAGGDEPRWQARAVIGSAGQLCITGGPRDLRTTPGRRATSAADSPPHAGTTCLKSDETAKLLVDTDYPGATVAAHGVLEGKAFEPTRVLVYAVTDAQAAAPRVRWGRTGELHPMRGSRDRMQLEVDRSPDGLDAEGQQIVASYPATISLRLWAAELDVPAGAKMPQVHSPDLPNSQPTNDTIVEIVGSDELVAMIQAAEKDGVKPNRRAERFPKPVDGPNDVARKMIAAFARDRTADDAVPDAKLTDMLRRQRVQPHASRKLTLGGDETGDIWLLPGGLDPVHEYGDPTICFVGFRFSAGQCRQVAEGWSEPLVETIYCSPGIPVGRTVVWALSPPDAATVELHGPGARVEEHPARELILFTRPDGERIERLVWKSAGKTVGSTKAPIPNHGGHACGTSGKQWKVLRKDSEGFAMMGGGEQLQPRPTPVG